MDCILSSIKCPSSLTGIEYSAFADCNLLTLLIQCPGDTNESIRKIGQVSFYFCSIRNINIPSTLTEIDDEAFCYCEKLRAVSINEGLRRLDEGRLLGTDCYALERFTLPSISSHAPMIYDCGRTCYWGG